MILTASRLTTSTTRRKMRFMLIKGGCLLGRAGICFSRLTLVVFVGIHRLGAAFEVVFLLLFGISRS